MRREHYFFLSAFVAGAALVKYQAPLLPVAAGIAAVGLWNWVQAKRRRSR
jgi:hypothetical protein